MSSSSCLAATLQCMTAFPSRLSPHSEWDLKEHFLVVLGVRSVDIDKRFVGHMVGTHMKGLCQARTESK